ncbi:thiamine phosphate synthase [Fusibacter sp. 3D3]|uniref:thiamine phosphate synthase n=1 Tax=Fusibacter sp. 3D3 TaxID=1048380 RepID=UPI000852B78D|nr:thiamine phosphate synthase [Fusibacter sp. 3D3]GAU76687.1 thiamin-phosphate pyrophosphorylase [Fusibacter sp. 3D3]
MVICVTDQESMGISFLEQFQKICNGAPDQIILRAKYLDMHTYERLAEKCLAIALEKHITLLFHSHLTLSKKLDNHNIHLPFDSFISKYHTLSDFNVVSVAVHSAREAQLAQFLGATQVIAGHVFQTDCKAAIEPRGLSFLKEICSKASIPVMAIGGVTPERYADLISSGATGVCIMSSIMNSPEPKVLIDRFKNIKLTQFKIE